MIAPDAPTDTRVGGLIASDINDPPSAPMAKSASSQARPTRRSKRPPEINSASAFIPRWTTLPWSSGAENSRYHSPS
jgi:hypothetical protein